LPCPGPRRGPPAGADFHRTAAAGPTGAWVA